MVSNPAVMLRLGLSVLQANFPSLSNVPVSCSFAIENSNVREDFAANTTYEWLNRLVHNYSCLPPETACVLVEFSKVDKRAGLVWLGMCKIEIWTLIGEENEVTCPIWSSRVGEGNIGYMTIRLCVSRSKYPKDIHNQLAQTQDVPSLENLRVTLGLLQDLKSVGKRECTMAYRLLERLFVYLLETLDRQITQARVHKATDHGRPVYHMDLRGNVIEDIVVLTKLTLEFCQQCLLHDNAYKYVQEARNIARDMVKTICRAVSLLLPYALIYLECTYPTLRHQNEHVMNKVFELHHELLSARTRLVFLRSGRSGLPPSNIDDLLQFLLNQSLQEARTNENWELMSYTSILSCTRDTYAQKVIKTIHRSLVSTASPNARDALRRVLVHICQISDILPDSLIVPANDIILPKGITLGAESSNSEPTGEGSYGVVYKGFKTIHGAPKRSEVAVKALRFLSGRTEEQRRNKRQVYLEIVYTWTLSHPHILPLLGITTKFASIALVSPWMPNGTVSDCFQELRQQSNSKLALVNICNSWIMHVASGLAYLHEEGVVHGDLRGSNILVDQKYRAIIADFGISLFAHGHSGNYASRRTGNRSWMAPELLNTPTGMTSRPTLSSDVYSFGIVCVEIYMGCPPFDENKDGDTTFLESIVVKGVRPARPEVPRVRAIKGKAELMPDGLWSLVERCWHKDKNRRPAAPALPQELASAGISLG